MTLSILTAATEAHSELDWRQANQQYLMAALSQVRTALERHLACEAGNPHPSAGGYLVGPAAG